MNGAQDDNAYLQRYMEAGRDRSRPAGYAGPEDDSRSSAGWSSAAEAAVSASIEARRALILRWIIASALLIMLAAVVGFVASVVYFTVVSESNSSDIEGLDHTVDQLNKRTAPIYVDDSTGALVLNDSVVVQGDLLVTGITGYLHSGDGMTAVPPTGTSGPGASNGPSVPVVFDAGSSDTRGIVEFRTHSGVRSTDKVVVEVAFVAPYPAAPFVILGAANGNAAQRMDQLYVSETSTTGFVVSVSGSLRTGASYRITYMVAG